MNGEPTGRSSPCAVKNLHLFDPRFQYINGNPAFTLDKNVIANALSNKGGLNIGDFDWYENIEKRFNSSVIFPDHADRDLWFMHYLIIHGCTAVGSVIHEIMHKMGFAHEQLFLMKATFQ